MVSTLIYAHFFLNSFFHHKVSASATGADSSKASRVSGSGRGVEMRRERMKVLAVDHALRRETHRASQLAHELQKMSIKRDSPAPLLSPGCIYKVAFADCQRERQREGESEREGEGEGEGGEGGGS